MSETVSVPDPVVVTAAAVSRRLGVSTKQLNRFLLDNKVEPTSNDPEVIYNLPEIVEALKSSGHKSFKDMQVPTVQPKSFYKGKFEILTEWAPPVKLSAREARMQSKASSPTVAPVSLRTGAIGVISATGESVDNEKDLAALSGFQKPVTVNQIAKKLNLPVQVAAEVLYGSGLPSTQLKDMLIVEFDGIDFGGFLASLPDGLREKALIAQANNGAPLVSHKNLARIFGLESAAVETFLLRLPGSPTSLSANAVDVVRNMWEFEDHIDYANRSVESIRVGGRRKNRKYVTFSELSEHFNISEEDARMLGKRNFFPGLRGDRVKAASLDIPVDIVNEMVDENRFTLGSMGKYLGVPSDVLARELLKAEIEPVRSYILKWVGGVHHILLYSEEDVHMFERSDEFKKFLEKKSSQSGSRSRKKVEQVEDDPYLEEIRSRVVVNVRERNSAPAQSVLYIGPTNSGKTYHSLNALFEEFEAAEGRGRFVYAGPLRMLAFEVYEKMVARFGADKVGFLTGEEQINPDAPMVACTVEMAPTEGTSLVLDETHWIVEPARGQHWTELLVSGKYKNMHILTAKEAVPTIKELVSDSIVVQQREFERKTPIVYAGELSLKQIPPKTAVVAFSRRTVYAVASELTKLGKRVGVLYGALPLQVRKAQIQKYVDGDYDIMVTTDVIGHGINLPIDNVVFAQTTKFDGIEQRDLYVWEMAQIAGRAGRFGLSVQGQVYGLKGRGWFSENYELIRDGALAAGGLIPTDLDVTEAMIRPSFRDLGVLNASEFPVAIVEWQQKAFDLLQDRPVQASSMAPMYELFEKVAEVAGIPTEDPERDWDALAADKVWQLMSGPFSAKNSVITGTVKWLMRGGEETDTLLEVMFDKLIEPVKRSVRAGRGIKRDQVNNFEMLARDISELKMVYVMFEHAGTLRWSELVEYEAIINELLIRSLSSAVKSSTYGKCDECGKSCPPWFSLCEPCNFDKRWW